MSKQERNGAWAIVILIIVILAAIFIEKRCSTENVDPSSQKQMNEYIEKTKDVKVTDSKSKKNKSTKNSKKTESKSKAKSSNKTTNKDKSKSKKTSKKQSKPKKSAQIHKIAPVPQF